MNIVCVNELMDYLLAGYNQDEIEEYFGLPWGFLRYLQGSLERRSNPILKEAPPPPVKYRDVDDNDDDGDDCDIEVRKLLDLLEAGYTSAQIEYFNDMERGTLEDLEKLLKFSENS